MPCTHCKEAWLHVDVTEYIWLTCERGLNLDGCCLWEFAIETHWFIFTSPYTDDPREATLTTGVGDRKIGKNLRAKFSKLKTRNRWMNEVAYGGYLLWPRLCTVLLGRAVCNALFYVLVLISFELCRMQTVWHYCRIELGRAGFFHLKVHFGSESQCVHKDAFYTNFSRVLMDKIVMEMDLLGYFIYWIYSAYKQWGKWVDIFIGWCCLVAKCLLLIFSSIRQSVCGSENKYSSKCNH